MHFQFVDQISEQSTYISKVSNLRLIYSHAALSILLKLDGLFVDSCVIGPRAAQANMRGQARAHARAGPASSAGQSFKRFWLVIFNFVHISM